MTLSASSLILFGMLSIKLKLIGKKGQRSFRVIVQEARAKLGGKFVEDLGWYNPHSNKFEIKKDRVLHWLDAGAQPTETVSQLLKKHDVKQPPRLDSRREVDARQEEKTARTAPEE